MNEQKQNNQEISKEKSSQNKRILNLSNFFIRSLYRVINFFVTLCFYWFIISIVIAGVMSVGSYTELGAEYVAMGIVLYAALIAFVISIIITFVHFKILSKYKFFKIYNTISKIFGLLILIWFLFVISKLVYIGVISNKLKKENSQMYKEAVRLQDYSLCEQQKSRSFFLPNISQCIKDIAVAKLDVRGCHKIKVIEGQIKCLFDIAIKQKDYTICNNVFDETNLNEAIINMEKNECLYSFAQHFNSYQICDFISKEQEKRNCIAEIARSRAEYKNKCARITNELNLYNCEREVAKLYGEMKIITPKNGVNNVNFSNINTEPAVADCYDKKILSCDNPAINNIKNEDELNETEISWSTDEPMDECFCSLLNKFRDEVSEYIIPRYKDKKNSAEQIKITKISFPERRNKSVPEINPGPKFVVEYKDGIKVRSNKVFLNHYLSSMQYCETACSPNNTTDKCYLACYMLNLPVEFQPDKFGRIQILNVYADSVEKEYFRNEAENILKQIGIDEYEIIGNFDRQSTIDDDLDSSYIIINGEIPETFSHIINPDLSNSELLDIDNDGLSIDEERLYMTDPNNYDSDSDGYSDGDEVKSGYNPLGEGKL